MRLRHMVATPAALDSAALTMMRLAPDEALALTDTHPALDDPHAIITFDDGFAGAWLSNEDAQEILSHHCEWEPPLHRPAFAQGALAGLPVKIWFEPERVLLLVSAPFAQELEERLK